MAQRSSIKLGHIKTIERRQILSLSGGGYMGLFTAALLHRLEDDGAPFHATTDLFCGTSVGSLIALGLAAGLPAHRIAQTMLDLGESIFPPGAFPFLSMLSQATKAGYDAAPLRKAITSLLEDRKLADVERHVLVPAVDLTSGTSRIFFGGPKTPPADKKISLVDVALASAAAPTYLPVHAIGTALYADGGLMANAPDALGASHMLSRLAGRRGQVRMLSIGTTAYSPALAGDLQGKNWGLAQWMTDMRLPKMAMAAQMDLSRETAKILLGSENVLVIDPVQSAEQQGVLGLDKASVKAKATLLAIAEKAARSVADDTASKRFMNLWRSHVAAR